MGTVGFVVSWRLGLYSIPLGNLNGFYFFLALFSALGLVVVICFIVFAVVLFIMDTIFEKLKNRKRAIKSSKLLGEVAKRLNPIKTKAEKLCIKIKYTD
nr:MAG TPA: ATPase [Bacteriophage sp.]